MKYSILYSDCPWRYDNERDHNPALGGMTYSTITLEDLCNLPIEKICDENCLLFMWATTPKLPEAFTVMKSWGFDYVTTAFIWVKLNPKGSLYKPDELCALVNTNGDALLGVNEKDIIVSRGIYSGLGSWTCQNVELLLMGRKGRFSRVKTGIKQVVFAPRTSHSHKPAIFRNLITELAGDKKRVELFATERAEGWDATGFEVDGKDIRDFLSQQ